MRPSRAVLHAAKFATKGIAKGVAKTMTKVAARAAIGILAGGAAYLLLPRHRKQRKVVVITGGSRGLGFALAERYGRSGAQLVLAARDADELDEARAALLKRRAVRHEDDILLVSADLTDEHQASGLIAHALEAFGRIDILINNAGIIEVGPAEDQPLEAYRRAIETNFYAALHTTYAALPYLLARNEAAGKHARDSGHANIVNITSIGGKFPVPHLLPYTASKFALTGFSEGLHAELRHKRIRVTTVCPGLMRTGGEVHAQFTGQVEREKAWFFAAARTPILSASVQRAAHRIFHAVADGRAEITITPQAWLAARIHGLCPETTQRAAALVNQFLLPAPAGDQSPISDTKGTFWHEDHLTQPNG
jgi:NAD(P)-dependent dehydrogenase (short-subunit alcohol dehydrogenase family)